MFKLNYQRVRKPDLAKMAEQYDKMTKDEASASTFEAAATFDYNPFRIANLQSYNPIYNLFFNIDSANYNKITLNHRLSATSLDTVIDSKNVVSDANIFVKSSPLLDPLHFLRGKYDLENSIMQNLPQLDSSANPCFPKLIDANNSAYVDGFFSYLTSMMHETHGWIHGVQYYGSFLGIQSRYKYNIADDMNFLEESEYFSKNITKYFDLDEEAFALLNDKPGQGSRRNRNKLEIKGDETIDNESIDLGIVDLDSTEGVADYASITCEIQNSINPGEDASLEYLCETEPVRSRASSSSSDSSSISNSSNDKSESNDDKSEDDNESNDDKSADDDEDSEDSDYTDYTDTDDKLFAYLHNFPVQLIFQEKCFGTFDDLLVSCKMSSTETIAALFQIIIILATYQKMFSFTHNDLHTNNIMYIKTDIEHINYRFNGVLYQVPTYGRIFKIIDFGRAIYRFNGRTFCSDSFAENGDANSQYNCEPYYNSKKVRVDPNPSFDLSRLGCSLYDFTMDSDSRNLKTLIDEWCEDDYGKNILYKSGGEERYPGFKLYKMIARIVNNLVPKDILCRPVFAKYQVADINSNAPSSNAPSSNAPSSNAPSSNAPSSNAPSSNAPLIDIDAMPVYIHNYK